MDVKKGMNTGCGNHRIRFPEDEKRHKWLGPLLDSFAITDEGIALALEQARTRGRSVACRQNCDECCKQADIPLYPHELVGIYWYVAEKMTQPMRLVIHGQLLDHAGQSCPFLVDHSCGIHPLRPLACRQFNVFTSPCAAGEDPYYTRREDVLVPFTEHTDRAFESVLSFYGSQPGVPVTVDDVRRQIMNLQTFKWKRLASLIEPGLHEPGLKE